MIASVALVLLLANPPEQTTLPRQPDVPHDRPADQHESRDLPGQSADYLFNKPLTATDDPAFVTSLVGAARQGALDARDAGQGLTSASVRAAAQKIGRQNEATALALESLARKKGWHVPKRTTTAGSVPENRTTPRAGADFIINQIAFHEQTLDQFRAQLDGKGDADLKRELRKALPGYQKNLELLLTLKP